MRGVVERGAGMGPATPPSNQTKHHTDPPHTHTLRYCPPSCPPLQTTNDSVQDVEAKYYANGEDAYEMRRYFAAGLARRQQRGGRGGARGSAAAASAADRKSNV